MRQKYEREIEDPIRNIKKREVEVLAERDSEKKEMKYNAAVEICSIYWIQGGSRNI